MNSTSIIQALASDKLGGGEMVAIKLAASLREKGEHVSVWCPKEGASADAARALDLPVAILGYDPVIPPNLSTFATTWIRTSLNLSHRKPTLVHCHSPFCYQRLARGIPKRIKTVAHVHIEEHMDLFPWLFKKAPDTIITCAEFLADVTRGSINASTKQPRIVAASNAVDTELFQPSNTETFPIGRKPVAVMLANLAPHKGHATAIEVISILGKMGVEVDLKIAGLDRTNTGFEDKLRALVRERKVEDQVSFLGFHEAPEELLKSADFMLLPSTAEGLPLSVLEAQASKTLVLANPVAGVPETITDNETGFLIHHADPYGYANKIRATLNAPTEWHRITSNAYKHVHANHTWKSYVEKIETIYKTTFPI